ncbi:DUF637 domain-containing protein [Proteus genomosp. 6]|uniref:DUF637 domain-containing protein n=1 Tax=Proteus genomosp. 6 TaxID=1311820 RepID=UPI0032DB0EDE
MDEKDISQKQCLISYSIIYLTAIYPLHPAWSSIITPSDKIIKISQQNTVPIINIATPNDIGVSHNQFHSFNVGKQGVVLNNATIPVNTQLAKQVNPNANLKSNAAHLIINEVVGNGYSQLLGKLEVAGEQAKVVIANPNGITCDGCSFINTPAITLTTGKPQFSPQGAYSAIEVKKGSVVIGKHGMNTELQNYADIISRSIELNGKINAKNLSLMQGNNRIDFEKGTVNSLNGESIKPTISIDTKALGGMYANQIRLVSTEKGVGVNLSDIQTTQNSMNLTVDGKITFNGNIQSEQDINVSSKELQINSNAKLKAKRDITLATHALTNHSEIISEKDMRLFADKLTNKGEKALIQAKDNLWIQKNAQGDPSSLIENQSATIKTEKGDLIIRTKKLVNESITPLFKEIKQEPDSKKFYSVRNQFIPPYPSSGFFQGNYEAYIIAYIPELIDERNKKWFGMANLNDDYGINSERKKIDLISSYIASKIISGNNLYIQSNSISNHQSYIFANNNSILTGRDAYFLDYSIGQLDKWVIYKNRGVFPEINPLFEIPNNQVEKSKYRKEYEYIPYVSTDICSYDFKFENNNEHIMAKGNLTLDFKNSINIETKVPFKYSKIKRLINKLHSGYNILASNILINSDSINISSNIKSNNDLSIISNDDITINDVQLSSKNSLSLISNKNIELNQVDLTAKDSVVLAKNGNINYTLNPISAFNQNNVLTPPVINVPNSILFQSGGDITFNNIEVNNSNSFNLISSGNIKIQRNESALFKILPYFHLYTQETALSKTESWKARGDITFTAGKDIISQGIKYHSDKAITFNAGQDIFLSSKSIKEADPFFSDIHYPQLQSKLFSDNNLILNAARDIDLSSTVLNSKDKVIVLAGRNIKLGANAYSAIKDPHEDAQDIQYATATITGNKCISITSSGTLITEGGSLKSEGDITISNGGNIQLGAVRTHFRKESGSELEDLRKQISTEINSSNNLTLLSEGSILFQASKLTANKEIDIAAKGGFLYVKAMEEISYYKEEKKKCNRWTLCITKKKYTKTFYNTNNKVTEFIANSNINLFAKDDITLEATKIDTAKNAKLTSKTGKVNFKAVKNTAFKQVITNSKDIYITQRDQGYTKGTWVLPELYIGGKLTIDAPKGITADIKAQKEQSLEQALTVLSNTPEYAWLKDLQRQENINWNLVKDTYSNWDDKTQQLNPVVGAVIAIAVGVATYGTATAATIGGMASEATIAAGASASVASTASVAAQAGFASLVSQAAVSLAENKGSIYKTIESLGRSDTAKSIVTSMVVAGALQGLDLFMGWDQAIQGGTLPSTGKLLLTDNATWNQVAQRVASHSVVSSTLGTAIQGGSFIDNFKTALLSNIGSQFHAEGANLIGDNGAVLGHAGKVLSHATLSGLSAQISGGNVKGAIVGSLAAEIAAISLGDNTIKAEEWQKKSESQAQFVRLFGGIAGGIFTGEPGGVYSGARGAENSFRYNYLSHHQQKLMEKELSAETNYFKKTAIYLKWLSADIGQDTGFNAGLVAGIPTGLYETIEGLASLATNPLETYQAIKAVIQSDNALDTLTQAVKQSYIDRIEKLEAEYQRAGVSGSFNAGVESGKLIFDLVGLFSGGVGVAKGSSQLIAKTSAKIIGKTTRVSFPDGISFQIELPKHLATVDKFTQKMGISGGHNANVFYNVVKDKDLKIIKELPTNVRGITYIEYKIPAKHPQTGEITHYKGNGAQPFKKTIYDPKVFSDQKILELGQKAAANGYKNALDKNLQSYDAISEGITFRVYLDKETKIITNFHPK